MDEDGNTAVAYWAGSVERFKFPFSVAERQCKAIVASAQLREGMLKCYILSNHQLAFPGR